MVSRHRPNVEFFKVIKAAVISCPGGISLIYPSITVIAKESSCSAVTAGLVKKSAAELNKYFDICCIVNFKILIKILYPYI
jgi:hypothetical protein